MLDQLASIKERFIYLEERLSDPSTVSDMKLFKKTNKEYAEIREIAELHDEYKNVLENIVSAKEMLAENDKELVDMAKMELSELEETKKELEEKGKILLIPKDPDDSLDVIFEIRSGTGGDEASIFAGDLLRMYTKYFETKKYKTELLFENPGSSGGYNKIVLEVTGDNVYGDLKFESGAHRVQRVPKTESQGRVHTSAATVVVIPKYEEEDIDIDPSDIRVDVYRASGAGGQHVNRTESAVRMTHIPTGIVAESQDSRSQIKNREITLGRLYVKIKEKTLADRDSEMAATRKSLVGSGDRSSKIRTYNYPQNRVTDHRINLTLYSLDKIVLGDIEEIISALRMADNAERMKNGES